METYESKSAQGLIEFIVNNLGDGLYHKHRELKRPDPTPIECLFYALFKIRSIAWYADFHTWKLSPQHKLNNYYVDFFFFNGSEGIIIELDGHEFHEKTKDQAARDKKRDRVLQRSGYKVYHFTGSEIWNDF